MDADSHGDEAQAGLSQLVGGKGILAGGEGLLEVAVRSASRRVGVPARNVSSSAAGSHVLISLRGGLTRLDLQDRVAVPPVEALQDDIWLVSKPGEALHE